MTSCSCRRAADAAVETLRLKFWEYIGGELSERDFKAAVAEYSAALRVEPAARIVGELELLRYAFDGELVPVIEAGHAAIDQATS